MKVEQALETIGWNNIVLYMLLEDFYPSYNQQSCLLKVFDLFKTQKGFFKVLLWLNFPALLFSTGCVGEADDRNCFCLRFNGLEARQISSELFSFSWKRLQFWHAPNNLPSGFLEFQWSPTFIMGKQTAVKIDFVFVYNSYNCVQFLPITHQ